MHILIALLFLALPAALLYLIEKQPWARKAGAIVLCYSTGLILGNLGLIPDTAQVVQTTLSEVSIALALPMLLLTLNVREWSGMAATAMLSLLFATTAVVTISCLLYFNLAGDQPLQASHLAAMSVGVYTGGTPNLAAIKSGLDIPNDLYILFHSIDTLLGAVYMLFMVSIAVPLFRRLLPPPSTHLTPAGGVLNSANDQPISELTPTVDSSTYDEDYSVLIRPKSGKQLGKILALAVLVVGLSLGGTQVLSVLLASTPNAAVTILLITSFGILLSFSSSVRKLGLAYKLGMYLIYVFCIVVASLADLSKLANFDGVVAVFLLSAVFGSLLLHALLCKLFKVDSDTFMVTSVSAICSPPFVPMMVKALKNPNVLLSGMTSGIVGMALGNYLGISLALFLQSVS